MEESVVIVEIENVNDVEKDDQKTDDHHIEEGKTDRMTPEERDQLKKKRIKWCLIALESLSAVMLLRWIFDVIPYDTFDRNIFVEELTDVQWIVVQYVSLEVVTVIAVLVLYVLSLHNEEYHCLAVTTFLTIVEHSLLMAINNQDLVDILLALTLYIGSLVLNNLLLIQLRKELSLTSFYRILAGIFSESELGTWLMPKRKLWNLNHNCIQTV